ncbi:hypothetical protein VW29_06770 [Devosia limi DSM 17137]|uniref:Winged helix DNA-binding domain-containing protein n=1 Tax=Devosia limi DSM 17137 TaxID=1121477 RepID=A0A0F5LSJ1_9HYPH|nr:winged helix DNA-binding domain-containing protein [Devosia limi]KKB85251.1 hypothetical protein VW29_06770 [Devosia limi DSM 17137]SHF87388.1 Winged helix DNA-binding domain-containing protein [Devosia limi DSM 17137]
MTTLTNRQLNRATLARQLLLQRTAMPVIDAVDLLIGLQAQTTNGPYQALWSRLDGFTPASLTAAILDKSLLRATTMRSTLHLHTVPDLLSIRPLVQPMLERTFLSAAKASATNAARPALHARGVALLDQQPMTAGELGKQLVQSWPDGDPRVLAQVLQCLETLIQIPPTRIWGHGGAPLLSRLENWLGCGLAEPADLKQLTLRYLAAFGPASISDMQTWCGLTRLAPILESLRPQLATFTAEDGRTLYDLPDAARPDADTPAPVRFLPEYDNVLLGYANRLRIQPPEAKRLMPMVNGYPPTFTHDGFIAGKWSLARRKDNVRLTIIQFKRLRQRALAEVEQEGRAMAHFLTEGKAVIDAEFVAAPA